MQLPYEGPLDPWVQFLITRKYETLVALINYDIEDFIHLYELALITTANEALSMKDIKK